MWRAFIFFMVIAAIADTPEPDSNSAPMVAETVFTALIDGNGDVIAANLSTCALADVQEILDNLRTSPDLTLAMLNFNWGVEHIEGDIAEWDEGDLLTAVFSSSLFRDLLAGSQTDPAEFEITGDSATVIWTVREEEWLMVLVLEQDQWKVSDIEGF